MPLAKLRCYDAIYFCGGSPEYLMKRIRRVRLAARSDSLQRKAAYMSASAQGHHSSVKHAFRATTCKLRTACPLRCGEQPGEVPLALCPQIRLTNSQALRVGGREAKVIE